MKNDKSNSRSINLLSWVLLFGAILVALILFLLVAWMWCNSYFSNDLYVQPEFAGKTFLERYLKILAAGFYDLTWIAIFVGVILLWVFVRDKSAALKRTVLALSLIFLHRFLQLTLIFLILSTKWKK